MTQAANDAWVAFVTDDVGASSLFQFREADTTFNDSIGSANIALTSGITTEQTSGLVGNTYDKSILGTGAVVIVPGTATVLTQDFTAFILFKMSSAPSGVTAMFGIGSNGTASTATSISVDSSTFSFTSNKVSSRSFWTGATAAGAWDGNWHLLGVQYRSTGGFMYYSFDGSDWATDQSTALAVDVSSGDLKVFVAVDYNGNFDANGMALDELVLVSGLMDGEGDPTPQDIFNRAAGLASDGYYTNIKGPRRYHGRVRRGLGF